MPKGTPTIQPAKTVEYTTPRELFDQLFDEVGGFDFDPFCRPEHYTAQRVLENGGTICIPPPWPGTITMPDYARQAAKEGRVLCDGLKQRWSGKVWVQPPYGPFLRDAVPRAVLAVEYEHAELVMALLPAKTEVRWFQEYVLTRARRTPPHFRRDVETAQLDSHPLLRDIRFIKGRLKFGGGDGGPARVGNVIVVWRK